MKEQRENWIQRRVKNSIRIWCAEKMNNEMNYNGLVVVQINQFYCCVCGVVEGQSCQYLVDTAMCHTLSLYKPMWCGAQNGYLAYSVPTLLLFSCLGEHDSISVIICLHLNLLIIVGSLLLRTESNWFEHIIWSLLHIVGHAQTFCALHYWDQRTYFTFNMQHRNNTSTDNSLHFSCKSGLDAIVRFLKFGIPLKKL